MFSPVKSSKIKHDQCSSFRVPGTIQCPKRKGEREIEVEGGGMKGGRIGREGRREEGRKGEREREGREEGRREGGG